MNLANRAAIAQDWHQVIYYLQQLPISKNTEEIKDKQNILNLALQVLLYGDFQEKWEISKFIPSLGNYIIKPLINLLEDETIDLEARWFIVRILGKFKEETVVIALGKLLEETEESELISIAGDTLAAMDKMAIDILINLLDKPEYCLIATRCLSCIRHPQTVNCLIKLAKSEDYRIRSICIEAFGSFRDDRVIPLLITGLKDNHAKIRKKSAIALRLYSHLAQEFDLVNHLRPLLHDIDLDVCRQAALTLGKIDNQEVISILNKILQSHLTPLVLKKDLVRIIARSELELALDYLVISLEVGVDTIKKEVLDVLGRIKKDKLKNKATNIILDFAKSDREQNNIIKQAISTSLGQLGKSQSINTLQQLAIDPEKKVRLHAIASLKKLGAI